MVVQAGASAWRNLRQMNPELLSASQLPREARGTWGWDSCFNTQDLEYSANGLAAVWRQRQQEPGDVGPRLWVPVQSRARLHSGDFRWNFLVKNMAGAQLGVGFMLDWTVGPDWGFFGYLGSSSSAWAYDPSSGDVVLATRSIEGGLPTFPSGEGVVTVEAHLPRQADGLARFLVNGVASGAVWLPPGAVLVPAACFLEVGQQVTLGPLKRPALDISTWLRGEDSSEPLTVPVPMKRGFLARLKGKLLGLGS